MKPVSLSSPVFCYLLLPIFEKITELNFIKEPKMKKITIVLGFLLSFNFLFSQNENVYKVHSHNDYLQNVPFWKAYAAGASSIEADLFLVNKGLYVAHTKEEIKESFEFERLYLKPIEQVIDFEGGLQKPLQLLVDLKSEAEPTLATLIKVLEKHPKITSEANLKIVISGNRPEPANYIDYPSYIYFDYQSLDPVQNADILKKIALVSLSFKGSSPWNGKGRLTAEDLKIVKSTIEKAKALKKPFRFWATPDSKTAWKALAHLGVDYINTDMPFECKNYLQTLPSREYRNTIFSEVYRPTFEVDQTQNKVENVILMIGDGNGLTQISAAVLANKGETTLTQLKSIGFLKTQSADDFTTDSAGAGTALATGKKAPNRAIGMTIDGKNAENITELLDTKGYVSGLVTTDEISGATPSSFYAHQKDRSQTDEIRSDLEKSKLAMFISNDTRKSFDNKNSAFSRLEEVSDIGISKSDKVAYLMGDESSNDNQKEALAKATKNAIAYFEKKSKPFFLMVEGAKIDSYGHANKIDGVVKEGIGFDKAITEAIKFADTSKNTLVIITADHETGGLTIPQGNMELNEIEGDFTTDDHTATMVPIFAYGPQSQLFQGVYENNEVFHKIIEVLQP